MKILKAKAIPIVLGGDHYINIPCIDAFENEKEFHLIQIDAHLDFVDERHGVRYDMEIQCEELQKKNS